MISLFRLGPTISCRRRFKLLQPQPRLFLRLHAPTTPLPPPTSRRSAPEPAAVEPDARPRGLDGCERRDRSDGPSVWEPSVQCGSELYEPDGAFFHEFFLSCCLLLVRVWRGRTGGKGVAQTSLSVLRRNRTLAPSSILPFPLDPHPQLVKPSIDPLEVDLSIVPCPQFTKHLPMPLLKHAFQVSNSYVLRKLVVLLWPWRHRQWARTVRRNNEGQGEGWASPREDLNAPDLYIPSASFSPFLSFPSLAWENEDLTFSRGPL